MQTDNIEVSVETKDSRPIRTYRHENRVFIESKENATYQIRVKNKTGKRIKAVISVDSVSIVTGKSVSTDPTETGYILGPYAEELFKGFRVDENQVAEFKFVKREASYATETGDGQGNGVIAIRAYAEKEKPATDLTEVYRKLYEQERNKPREKEYIWPQYPPKPWYYNDWWWDYPHRPQPIWYCGGTTTLACGTSNTISSTIGNCSLGGTVTNNMAQCCVTNAGMNVGGSVTSNTVRLAAAAVAQSNVEEPSPFGHGSSWGSAIADKVTEVAFEVGVLLAEVAVYYAPLAGLVALGVNVSREKQVAFPEPFKREFAAPPKGWHSGVK